MAALDMAERQEGEMAQAKSVRLKDKIAQLREQVAAFAALAPPPTPRRSGDHARLIRGRWPT
jgi:hypothetical protein